MAAVAGNGRYVKRLMARAFVHPLQSGGGNPVTVYYHENNKHNGTPSSGQRSALAQACEWESVVVVAAPSSFKQQDAQMYFYMPSGDEVSFCAHAAMAACSVISKEKTGRAHDDQSDPAAKFTTGMNPKELQVGRVNGATVELAMNGSLEETPLQVENDGLMEEMLAQLGLTMNQVVTEESTQRDSFQLPSVVNSSVARPKTLIRLDRLESLQTAQNPPNAARFQELCTSLHHSTGIYLYHYNEAEKDKTEERQMTLECRQFPYASGYPEDPATGIAAAALAASLRKRNAPFQDFVMIQGTAMGRPSQINMRVDHNGSLFCSGLVEILSQDDIEIPALPP